MNRLSNLLVSDIPKYEVVLPSSGDKKSFRPFLVKEEKVLLLAQQSEEDSSMIRAIQNIIESCVDDIEDAGSLPLFDVEYIFLQIRGKSVGEGIEPIIICPFTEEEIPVKVLIPDIKVTKTEGHTKEIEISKESPILKDIKNQTDFYFVHSYKFVCEDNDDILTTTKYEDTFVSSVCKKNIFGVQFHPEKSLTAGLQLIKNFIDIKC